GSSGTLSDQQKRLYEQGYAEFGLDAEGKPLVTPDPAQVAKGSAANVVRMNLNARRDTYARDLDALDQRIDAFNNNEQRTPAQRAALEAEQNRLKGEYTAL